MSPSLLTPHLSDLHYIVKMKCKGKKYSRLRMRGPPLSVDSATQLVGAVGQVTSLYEASVSLSVRWRYWT